MRRDFAAYLCDIQETAIDLRLITGGFTREMYEDVRVVQLATERSFEIIGEAVTQCRHHHPDEIKALGDVQGIVDFRNHLAHRYHLVSNDVVWDILQHDLEPLLGKVKELLQGTSCY